MIALFARSNHPHGYGYSTPQDYTKPGIGAHGYVVVGFVCRSRKQVKQVIDHVRRYGIDLPDVNRAATGQDAWRAIWAGPKEEMEGDLRADGNRYYYHLDIGRPNVVRWYSGGPGDWDFLFTAPGSKVEYEWPGQHESRGDNRFCMIYDASELLRKD